MDRADLLYRIMHTFSTLMQVIVYYINSYKRNLLLGPKGIIIACKDDGSMEMVRR